MPPKKKPTTTPKSKAKKNATSTSKPQVKKPTAKSSGKNTTTTPKKRKTTSTQIKVKQSADVSKKSTKNATKSTTRKKPEPKPTFKRKELTPEQMFPYESFTYRLEYQDGKDHRICHFQCEEHRTKHIQRYKLRKGSYFIDTLT